MARRADRRFVDLVLAVTRVAAEMVVTTAS
jgi:hypothetical protein